jgi:carboxypeptidase Q
MLAKLLRHTLLLVTAASASASFSAMAELPAAQKQQLDALKATTLNSDLSYQLIESLTTEVGSRMMGTPGDARAIKWAQAKMNTLGFDKVWTEEVVNREWLRGDMQAKILAPFPHKVSAISLGGSVGTGSQGITAQVVHFTTLDDLKAAKKDSLKGKIAFISYRMKRDIDGEGYSPAVQARVYGAIVAAEKGAVALIIRSVGTDNNRSAHTGSMYYKEEVTKIPAVALSNPDADLLVNQFKRDQDVSFYLQSSASIKTTQVKSANVIGEITGSELPNEIIAIGAHLDSWDVGTGAIDDGLGIGMMLAAAHHIAQLPVRPKRTIRVILFAAEEIGMLGAKKYMALHKDEIKNHMMGAEWDFGTGRIYSMKPGVGASALNTVRDFADYLAPMGISLAPENDARADSDMGRLSDAGMPSMAFLPDGNAYFDYHHTENDTFDKVDPQALKHNTAVYTLFAYFAAQSTIDFRK